MDLNPESEARCPGCQTPVTAAAYHVGREVERGPIRQELTLKPCWHRYEGADADLLYARFKKLFEAAKIEGGE